MRVRLCNSHNILFSSTSKSCPKQSDLTKSVTGLLQWGSEPLVQMVALVVTCGQCLNTPRLSRLLRIVEQNGKRRSKARKTSFRNHFGHFLAQVKIEVTRGQNSKIFKTVFGRYVTRISFIFEATTSISWLQNYASQLQPDYENAPQTSRIEDGSGRLVGVSPHQCGVRAALECQDGRWAINQPVRHHNKAAAPIYRPIFQTADPI